MQSRARSSYAEPQPLLADATCLQLQRYNIWKGTLSAESVTIGTIRRIFDI